MNNIHVCPVCKSDKVIIEKYFISHGMDGSYENWSISCNNCKLVEMDFAADGFYGRDYLKSKEEVIQKWNETCALYDEKEK